MGVVVVVGLTLKGLVGPDNVENTTLEHPFARRTALMQAMIAIGVIGPRIAIDPHFQTVLPDNADVPILHFAVVTHEYLRHYSLRASLKSVSLPDWATHRNRPARSQDSPASDWLCLFLS